MTDKFKLIKKALIAAGVTVSAAFYILGGGAGKAGPAGSAGEAYAGIAAAGARQADVPAGSTSGKKQIAGGDYTAGTADADPAAGAGKGLIWFGSRELKTDNKGMSDSSAEEDGADAYDDVKGHVKITETGGILNAAVRDALEDTIMEAALIILREDNYDTGNLSRDNNGSSGEENDNEAAGEADNKEAAGTAAEMLRSAAEIVIRKAVRDELMAMSEDGYLETAMQQAAAEAARQEEARRGMVNINTADVQELMKLEGIGEKRASDIVKYREQHGVFKTPSDIMKVSGIKESLYEKFSDKIYVN